MRFQVPGGAYAWHYKMCWSQEGNESLAEYRTQIDPTFEVKGPWTNNYTCTLGLPCNITLQGYRLEQTNHLVILDHALCGEQITAYPCEILCHRSQRAVALLGLGTRSAL